MKTRILSLSLAVVLVALLAASAWFWFGDRRDDGGGSASTTARTAAVTFFSLDHDDASASIDRLLAMSTGRFKTDYAKQRTTIEKQVQAKQLTVTARVPEHGTALEFLADPFPGARRGRPPRPWRTGVARRGPTGSAWSSPGSTRSGWSPGWSRSDEPHPPPRRSADAPGHRGRRTHRSLRPQPAPASTRPAVGADGRYRVGTLPDRDAVRAAVTALPLALSYDYRAPERTLAAATSTMTPDFADEFRATFDATVRPLAVKEKAVTQAKVRLPESSTGPASASPAWCTSTRCSSRARTSRAAGSR